MLRVRSHWSRIAQHTSSKGLYSQTASWKLNYSQLATLTFMKKLNPNATQSTKQFWRLMHWSSLQMRWSACTGCTSRSASSTDYKIAVLTFKVPHGIAPEYLGPVVRVADSLLALLTLTAWWCHRLNCQQLALELSLWPVLASGIVCHKTLHRHRHCRPSAND